MRTDPAAEAALWAIDPVLQECVIDLHDRLALDAASVPPEAQVVHVFSLLDDDGLHVFELTLRADYATRTLAMVDFAYHPPQDASRR